MIAYDRQGQAMVDDALWHGNDRHSLFAFRSRGMRGAHGSHANKSYRSRFVRGTIAARQDGRLMTLDQAHDKFTAQPSERSAREYLLTAFDYAKDYMIGLDEFTAIHQVIVKYLRQR